MVIEEDDPRRPDVVRLLKAHLALMRSLSPPGSVHALDLDGLTRPEITFWTARNERLLGCGAMRALDATHGEIKSMHVAEAGRRRGVGRAMVAHVIEVARARGYTRLSLETGRPDTFAAAQRLYEGFGFRECAPFADYTADPFSLCMTREL